MFDVLHAHAAAGSNRFLIELVRYANDAVWNLYTAAGGLEHPYFYYCVVYHRVCSLVVLFPPGDADGIIFALSADRLKVTRRGDARDARKEECRLRVVVWLGY